MSPIPGPSTPVDVRPVFELIPGLPVNPSRLLVDGDRAKRGDGVMVDPAAMRILLEELSRMRWLINALAVSLGRGDLLEPFAEFPPEVDPIPGAEIVLRGGEWAFVQEADRDFYLWHLEAGSWVRRAKIGESTP